MRVWRPRPDGSPSRGRCSRENLWLNSRLSRASGALSAHFRHPAEPLPALCPPLYAVRFASAAINEFLLSSVRLTPALFKRKCSIATNQPHDTDQSGPSDSDPLISIKSTLLGTWWGGGEILLKNSLLWVAGKLIFHLCRRQRLEVCKLYLKKVSPFSRQCLLGCFFRCST